MNVLMISDVYFPRINGVSTSIETFRRELLALGTRSSLIAPAYPGESASTPDIVRIPSRQVPLDPEDRLMQRGAILNWLRDIPAGRYDLVHIQTPFLAHYLGLRIAQRLDVPVVATYHTYFEEYLHHYVPFAPRAWMRALARRFSRGQCNALDAVVVPSSAMRDTLLNYGVRSPLHILPTGLPEERFIGGDGECFRAHHQIPADRPLLLFVGRVAFEKNIDFLLRVVARVRTEIPQVLLLVTGEGPALDDLRKQATQRGLDDNVRFLGYLDRHRELADCYRAADLFVFASRTETQGLVLLEAMALGTPVLALAEMGTRDILIGAAGAEIAPHDEARFAEQAIALLKDRERLAQMAKAARTDAQAWSARSMAQRLDDLYRAVCVQHAERRNSRVVSASPSTDSGLT